MNETFMVQDTDINDEDHLSPNKIQFELKTVVNNEPHLTNQKSLLEFVILPKNQDDIVVS